MICLLLLAFFGGPGFDLTGGAVPVWAGQDGAGGLWLIGQEEGRIPEWWLWRGEHPQAVAIPAGTLFAAPNPHDAGLILVSKDELAGYDYRQNRLQKTVVFNPIDPPLSGRHPWLLLQVFASAGAAGLAFFDGSQAYRAELGGTISRVTLPAAHRGFGGKPWPDHELEVTFGQPIINKTDNSLWWSAGGELFGWPVGREVLDILHAPPLRSIETAVPVPLSRLGKADTCWLLYGGERGDFSSFGWRLVESGGQTAAKGEGIVVRHGTDSGGRKPRLFVFTVSNSLGTQLRQALSGSTRFNAEVLILDSDRWRSINSLDLPITKDKSKPRLASGFFWSTDWNGDGWTDLFAVDPKKGVKVMLSKGNGELIESLVDVAGPAHAVVFFNKGLLRGIKLADRWRIEIHEAK